MGRDSSVGIATLYGLDGPGIEYRWARDLPHPCSLALDPTQPPSEWVLGPFPGGKAVGHGVNDPPIFSAQIKERVELPERTLLFTCENSGTRLKEDTPGSFHILVSYHSLSYFHLYSMPKTVEEALLN